MKAADLASCTGATLALATTWEPLISAAMAEFGITTPIRQAAFLAQIGHESEGLRCTTEIWGPTPQQRGYEGRADLGNNQPGDGSRYRGRGLIQTTGKANYLSVGQALGVDLVANPQLLQQQPLAARSAGWFWAKHGLNELADAGEFITITRKINGGTNGLAHRQVLYAAAKIVLKA